MNSVTAGGSREAFSSITLFAGRFGSGKTETALNYAVSLAREAGPGWNASQCSVILVDLDIVTPYFRSREMAEAMRKQGVEVIAPSTVGQHLDTPAITPQILGAIQQRERATILDVGGDRQGARALGQFSAAISERGYTMHFVTNPYRPFTDTLEGQAKSIAEIEASARLKVTSLVSNPNLMAESTAQDIIQGHAQVEQFGRILGLPIAFMCLERRWAQEFGSGDGRNPADIDFAPPILILDRNFVPPWENNDLPATKK